MQITKQELLRKNASPGAIQNFVQYAGGDTLETEWTLATQLDFIQNSLLRKWVWWAWREGIVPLWSMRGANLSEANLSGADLLGANLSEADLSGADLSAALEGKS